MHLYGPWTLDACLLQIKDRYSRSNMNDCKNHFLHLIDIKSIFLASRMNDIDKTLDNQVFD
jgi:hypothetical protein